jgi:hypothetical protein
MSIQPANLVVLEFTEPVTPEALEAIEQAVVAPHAIPELKRAHLGYYDGFGRLVPAEVT